MTPISLILRLLSVLLPAIVSAVAMHGYMSGKIEALTLEKQAAQQTIKDDEKVIEDLKTQMATNGRITNDYETKLSQLRSNFTSKSSGVRNTTAANQVPANLSSSSDRAHAASSDPIFVEQCTETTLMLSTIQAWAKAQGLAQE